MRNMKKILMSAILMIGLIMAPSLDAATATVSDVKTYVNGEMKAFTVDETDPTKLSLSVGYSVNQIMLSLTPTGSENGKEPEVTIKKDNAVIGGISSVLNLEVGKNTYTLEVKDSDDTDDSTKTTYTLEITREEKILARLTNLEVKVGNTVLPFDKAFDANSEQEYTITVDNDVKNVVIVATYDKDKIEIVNGDGEQTLYSVGLEENDGNVFIINVFSKDSDSKSYKITIYRKESQLLIDLKDEVGDDWEEIFIDEDANGKESVMFVKGTMFGENAALMQEYIVYLTDEVNDKDTVLASLAEAVKKPAYISQLYFNEDYTLTEEILNGLKKLTGTVQVDGYNGLWTINTANLTDGFKGLDFKILVDEEVEEGLRNKVLDLIENKDKATVIDFAHNGNLPKDTKVRIYVDPEKYGEEELTLYLYNTKSGKLNVVTKKLKVMTGEYGETYVEFELDHCSTYVLTTSSNNAQTGVLNVVLYVVMSLVSLAGIIFLSKKKAN